MATINGTLKYKQDDGSIVELNPVGVDSTARTSLNNIATQIQCIEQTTGFKADPAHVPATSMKVAIDALNTKVADLEHGSGTQTVYHVPVMGVITGFFNHGFIVTIPMPENLITALINGKRFHSAVLKRLGGTEENAILHGYKRDGAAFSFQIPVNTEVQVSRSPTLLEYGYVNTDMDFNANDYGGVSVFMSSSTAASGGIFVEVTLD